MKTGIIILAAGASTRLGIPKQTLPYRQTTLLSHSIMAAVQTKLEDIIVVLGANAEQILPSVSNGFVTVVVNEKWNGGMSTSIQAGLSALLKQSPQMESVIIMLCDQPFVSAALLNDLIIMQKESGKAIVASAYNNTLGVPVLFDKQYFNLLFSLRGEEGAKKLLYQCKDDIAMVDFPEGNIDIDTQDDVDKLTETLA